MSALDQLRDQILAQSPTEEQRKAIFADELEFLLRASPGSGKTWTSCRRFIWRGAKRHGYPGGLALLSFTNTAIREFQAATIKVGRRELLSEPNKWLTQVYESVKPIGGNGKLLWHRLGAKTIDLINENVHVEAVRDDIEALVLDAEVLDSILQDKNPAKKAKVIEIQLIARLRKHAGNPKFTELGERLEKIREKHEQGLLNSLEFLKAILEVAKDTVAAENAIDPEEEQDRALTALTELFNEVKSKQTHVIVERIVADIDAIVRIVRFDGWQGTAQGEREVKQALRRTLLKYKLHTDQELFEKAYGYIREYY
jgi:type I restriction enzyme R subunit